jgi:hypothetical protein
MCRSIATDKESGMRNMKKYGTAVAAASMLMALVGASSASAANWDPQGPVFHGHWTLTLHFGPATVTCTVTLDIKATAALAQTTNAGGTLAGPTFNSCSNSLGISPTVATSSASWTATATSTTAVDVTKGNAFINIGNGVCTITMDNVSVPGNTWSNAAHTLTANSTPTFPITTTGFCPGVTSPGDMTGSIVVPAATIT